MNGPIRFWEEMPLEKLSREEWESLCDGCGKCCLCKLRDGKTGEYLYTNVACDLLDLEGCRCGDYHHRSNRMPECITLTPESCKEFLDMLPGTCAYRLLAEGKPLPDWHPLISGDSMNLTGSSHRVYERVIHAKDAGDLVDHLVTWFY